jgi:amicyanin
MKKILGIVVIVLILGGGAFALAMRDSDDDKTNVTTPAATANDTSMTQPEADSKDAAPSSAPTASSSVTIQDFAFAPASITVKKGSTVTWTNQDSVDHSVVPDSATSDFKSSDMLSKGDTYKVTFNTTGTFSYHCGPHPNMKGTVTVTE